VRHYQIKGHFTGVFSQNKMKKVE